MPITTVTSRNFARDLAYAKKAACAGPVIVTDRGRPTYALLKIDDYYKLSGVAPKSLAAVMDAIPGGDFEFEPPTLGGNDLNPADFR
jgi:hypothetical protein